MLSLLYRVRRALPAAGLALVAGFLMVAAERYREQLRPPVDRVTAAHREMPTSVWQLGNGFHPASHFWPLQLVGTGIVLALPAAATAAAFLILRRHA
ncbi:hypothetical protein AB0D12_38530 [Streptomyces sp. NPDC048479]|uniref:hypothetical protein n=1 Tax=Streptomyces sp. NPDC048479 TaxID=3154725 RepID=UPI003436D7FB